MGTVCVAALLLLPCPLCHRKTVSMVSYRLISWSVAPQHAFILMSLPFPPSPPFSILSSLLSSSLLLPISAGGGNGRTSRGS